MMEENNLLNADLNLNSLKINNYEFLVNKEVGKNLHLLHNFEHVIPKYDKENGPHIEVGSADNSVTTKIRLKKAVLHSVMIDGA